MDLQIITCEHLWRVFVTERERHWDGNLIPGRPSQDRLSGDTHFALKVEINTATNLDSFRFTQRSPLSTFPSVHTQNRLRVQGTNWKRIFLQGSIEYHIIIIHPEQPKSGFLLILPPSSACPLCHTLVEVGSEQLNGKIKPQRGGSSEQSLQNVTGHWKTHQERWHWDLQVVCGIYRLRVKVEERPQSL